MTTQYKAQIMFTAYEDVYEDGESGSSDNSWNETLTADTQSELRNKILETTYSQWQHLDDDQANEYDWCTEYQTSYLATVDNQGDATEREIELWKVGQFRLWAVHCHILVTKITESKSSL